MYFEFLMKTIADQELVYIEFMIALLTIKFTMNPLNLTLHLKE